MPDGRRPFSDETVTETFKKWKNPCIFLSFHWVLIVSKIDRLNVKLGKKKEFLLFIDFYYIKKVFKII